MITPVTAAIPARRATATPIATATAKAPAKARWLALDLFRFVAVVLMIQGHVFYEVVSQGVRDSWWYGYHGYVHGFTAPIFLFSSGMAFGITTLAKWEDHKKLNKTVYRRFERYLMLIGIGYVMHFHQLSLSWLMGLPDERLAVVTRVDALQHIGFALMIAEGLVLVLRKKSIYLPTIATLLIAAVISAPWVWNIDVSGLPIPVAAFVNNATGSIFPIVPWCGFLFSGILVARFVQARRKKPMGLMQLVVPLAIIAAALIFAGDWLAHSGFEPFPEHNFWKTSPYFFLIRLGGVIGVLAALCLLELVLLKRRSRRQNTPANARPKEGDGRLVRFVQIVGTQTLVLYVAHLMLLYGTGVTPGVRSSFHRGLDLWPAIGLVGLFFVAMGLLAYLWHWTKKHHHRAFEWVRYSITALIIGLILFT